MQLPSRTTVAAWLQNFTIEEGIQQNLINIVKAKHPELEAREVFLSFDEMSLKDRWVYDKVSLRFFCALGLGTGVNYGFHSYFIPFFFSGVHNHQSATLENKEQQDFTSTSLQLHINFNQNQSTSSINNCFFKS